MEGDIPGTEEKLLSSEPEVAVYRGKSVGLYKISLRESNVDRENLGSVRGGCKSFV